MTWVSDESASVVESVNSALSSVWLAILICAIVLFVFLVNVRTTVIVAITMPVTVTISLFFMRLWGQSLNTVTLLAIGLSTGVLVSNSIVVLENIVSKFETMDDHWEAARQGASEVTVAVLASAGTNVIVMLPISMMWSLVGKILAPFAITTLVVNAVSILISFTLTPILCAMLLQPASKRKVNAFSRLGRRWEVAFQRLASHYARWLRAVFDHRVVCVAVAVGFVAVFMLTMKFGGARVGFTFFETDDVGRVFIRVELPPYSNLALTEKRLEAIQGRLMEFSDLEHVMTTVGVAEAFGGQAREGVYMGQIELFFKSKLERDWTIHQRLQEIRDLLADETDCLVSASVTGKMGGQSLPIEYSLSGPDLAVLEDTARAIRDVGRRVPGVGMFETTVRDPKPELRIVPKRAVLADLGVSAATLGTLVRANIDGVEAASYKRGDRTYDIRVKLGEVPGKEQVRQFMLPGRDGKPIPLESVADVVDDHALLQVYRVDKRRAVVLLGDLVPGATLSRVGEGILAAVERENLIPPGYEFKTAGDSEMLGDAVADFGEAILLGTFLTVLLLSAMLESWTRPGIVLLTLPMGLIGVVASLAITGLAITILTLLGILMLIGIVVNAAILIVERMGQLEAEGMTKREALVVSMHDQFRPALMLILASGLGMLPIALSTGIGSENRMGIGVASVGGILVAGLFTLTVLPVVVSLFTRGERPQGR
jgi:HAE1 family hydrophobic/amphiphilic exporter-1